MSFLEQTASYNWNFTSNVVMELESVLKYKSSIFQQYICIVQKKKRKRKKQETNKEKCNIFRMWYCKWISQGNHRSRQRCGIRQPAWLNVAEFTNAELSNSTTLHLNNHQHFFYLDYQHYVLYTKWFNGNVAKTLSAVEKSSSMGCFRIKSGTHKVIHVNLPWSSGRLPEMSLKISSKTYHISPKFGNLPHLN